MKNGFSKKVIFTTKNGFFSVKYGGKTSNDFLVILLFTSKSFFMSIDPKKKSFLKSHFGQFDMKNGFFFHIIQEKKPLFVVKTTLWTK
jgi:hypothetical protein